MSMLKQIDGKSASEIFEIMSRKMGVDQDDIDIFLAVLETLETICEKKIRPSIQEWDEIGAKLVDGKVVLPPKMEEVVNEMIKDNELYSFFVPKELGGMGFGSIAIAAMTEVLAKYDISTQVLTFISLSVMEALIVYHQPNYDSIIKNFSEGKYVGYVGFTESEAGSNLEAVKTTSVLEGDEYVINGTKIFISNGGYAETGLVLAKNMVNGKMEGHNVFIVEGLEGITTERLEHKSGLKANPTAQLHFKDVRVPKENIIAGVGEGYKKVLERLMGMRLGVTFQAMGAAVRATELAKEYAEERMQFGKPISAFPGVSRKLKAMEVTLPRMRTYGFMSALALERYYKNWLPFDVGATGESSEKMAASSLPGAARGGLTHYFISSAKNYTTEIVNHLAYDAQQIFGGNGFVAEYEVNKIARDVRVLNVYEGTSEIHEFIIKRAQQAIALIPESKFPKISKTWAEESTYEKLFYARFPDLKGLM
ncbi:MAG: acyl-CoA dehydrogenase family protein [Candidatus Heimdallarchaeota archaeon]|nr:acyl-CoA dehydrogenase family protein [Candidatus Heimdallarchaeota archaeon]